MVKLLSDELIKSLLCKIPDFINTKPSFKVKEKLIVLSLGFARFVNVIYVIGS